MDTRENDWMVLQDGKVFTNFLDSEEDCIEHIDEVKSQGYKGVFTYRLMENVEEVYPYR